MKLKLIQMSQSWTICILILNANDLSNPFEVLTAQLREINFEASATKLDFLFDEVPIFLHKNDNRNY